MNILGLNFGHDAGVAILTDGLIVVHLLRERHRRVKKAVSLDVELIAATLAQAGLTVDDIDFCAVTTTQGYEYISDDGKALALNYRPHPGHIGRAPLAESFARRNIDLESVLDRGFLGSIGDGTVFGNAHRAQYPEYRGSPEAHCWTGALQSCLVCDDWVMPSGLAGLVAADYRRILSNDDLRLGMHFPMTVQLFGRSLPAYSILHHAAHAASGYYPCGRAEAAIITHDGVGFAHQANSGMFWYGEGRKIHPLTPHHLAIAQTYDLVGMSLGFEGLGASGKLMGLAPYGKPAFFDRRFVGNIVDLRNQCGIQDPVREWLGHCHQMANAMGYDAGALADSSRLTHPINADIAASTQKLFEETLLQAVNALHRIFRRGVAPMPATLCFSGGSALNCPSNSRLWREGPFPEVFVPADCDDSGLAVGGALWLYHNVFDLPLPSGAEDSSPVIPYHGRVYGEDQIVAALAAEHDNIQVEHGIDAAGRAALDLAANRVIAWFEGRSEIGPRALGHRSILADPRHKENWERVNRLKGRESWRPFAPAVLAEEAHQWFRGTPLPSPFMLFTGQVISDALPAVTHVDGSARIQTVTAGVGEFYRLLKAFHQLTGVPVVMNTSFNGPGEPIVESPRDALEFLLSTELDALYLGNCRVIRRR